MASGVKITDEVKEAYTQVAMKTVKTAKLRFAVFKFNEANSEIVLDSSRNQSDDDDDYDAFVKDLPPKDVRYVAYDLPYTNKDGTVKSDIIFLSWCPDSCTIKQKMLCASSLNPLKQSLGVNKNVIQGDCLGEVDYLAVLEKVGGTPCKK